MTNQNNGFTFIEIIVTITIAAILTLYLSFVFFIPHKSILAADKNFQNYLKLQMIIENITYDYVYRCFGDLKENNLSLEELQDRIGEVGKIIDSSDRNKHPYGTYGVGGSKYQSYFVKSNSFVEEEKVDDKKIDYILKKVEKTDEKGQNILHVTIKLSQESKESISVLFTKKDQKGHM